MKKIDYSDQSPYCSEFYDRRVESVYTEYGIKCIDSQFCARIQNIDERIARIVSIQIERMLSDSSWLNIEDLKKYRASGLKAEISMEDFFKGNLGGWGNELRIIWENGSSREFFYWDKVLVIDPKTGKEDPDVLRVHILENQHLHNDIKNNLIFNLDYNLGLI